MRLVCTLPVLVALVGAPTVHADDNMEWRGTQPQVRGKSCQELTMDDCLFIDEAIANCPETCARRNEGKEPEAPAGSQAPSSDTDSDPEMARLRRLPRAELLEGFKKDCAQTVGRVSTYFAEPVARQAYVNRCFALILKAWDSKSPEFRERMAKVKEKVKGEYRTACEKKRKKKAAETKN